MRQLLTVLLLTFSLTTHAGLLSGLGKLGKAGKKSDDVGDAATSAGRHGDNPLGAGMHGDNALGGAGGYIDDISLPAIAMEVGGFLLDMAMNIAEFASEEAINAAAEAAFPDNDAAQSLMRRQLLSEPVTLDRNKRGVLLFTRAEIKAKANTIYIGSTSRKIKDTTVSQFICNTTQGWQRFTTLQPLLGKVISNECGLRKRGLVLFFNHQGFVDFSPNQLPQDHPIKATFAYAANAISNRIHPIDFRTNTRRLEKCCLYGDKTVHPGLKNSLTAMTVGSNANTHIIYQGTAPKAMHDLAAAQRFTLSEAKDAAHLKTLVNAAKKNNHTLFIVGDNPAGHKQAIVIQDAKQLFVTAWEKSPAIANVWQLLGHLGTKKTPVVLRQTTLNETTATYTGQVSTHGVTLNFTLNNDEANGCNPYIWHCKTVVEATKPATWYEILASIIGVMIALFMMWKAWKLWTRLRDFVVNKVKDAFKR